MPIQCPTCSRLNPENASYCYYDGRNLQQSALIGPPGLGAGPFPLPFSFSDGHGCFNFNQLALACDQRWNEARNYLVNGTWMSYFTAIGRNDLAALAVQSAQETDPDVGLCRLLEGLPVDAEALRPAKLALTLTEEDLGSLDLGKDYKFDLVIENQGTLVLRGSMTAVCDWLSFGDNQGNGSTKLFQTRDTFTLPVRVLGSKLRAGKMPLETQIEIDTNGGRQTVVVRATVPIRPFPRGQTANNVLAGATSPREIAVKAKAHLKEATVLFEQGAVKAWYESNGWTYPVRGTQAKGKCAVQQFFEALGLTKPPRLEIDTQQIVCQGEVGTRLTKNVIVHTAESKFVHADAHSNQDWIKVLPAKPQGNSIALPLCIETPPRPGETLNGIVTFLGNGQQCFTVPVTLTVAANTVAANPEEQEEQPQRRNYSLHWAVGGSILFGTLVIALIVVLNLRRSPPEIPSTEPVVSSSKQAPKIEHWWDEFPDTKLTALVVELKKAARKDQRIFERIQSNVDGDRRNGYKQLAAKLEELALKPELKKTLAGFVTGCCVYDPSDPTIEPLLGDLRELLYRRAHKGEEVEPTIFWLGVVCDAIGHKDTRRERRQRLVSDLRNALAEEKHYPNLDPRDPPEVFKENAEMALARVSYSNLRLTAESSIKLALKIREVLIAKFPQHLKADFRFDEDKKLLQYVLSRDESALAAVQMADGWSVEKNSHVPQELVKMLNDRLPKLKPEQMKDLRPLLSHKDTAIVLVVLEFIPSRKVEALDLADGVVELIQHSDSRVREAARNVHLAMGAAVEKTLPDLPQRLLRQLHQTDKTIVAEGLQMVQGHQAAALAPKVVHLLDDPDAKVRKEAVNALRVLGPDAEKVSPHLAQLHERRHKEKDPAVRQALDRLMESRLVRLKREQIKDALPPLLRDTDVDIVLVALKVVRVRKAEAEDMAEEVADLLKRSSDKEVSKEALNALQALGPAAAKALPKLFDCLENKHAKYRRTDLALSIAGIVDTHDAANVSRLVPVLLEGLRPQAQRKGEETDEEKINEALIKFGQPAVDGCFKILDDSFKSNFTGSHIDYRMKLYKTLANLGEKHPSCKSDENWKRIQTFYSKEYRKQLKGVTEACSDAVKALDPR